eukprot:47898_1
MTVSMVQLFCMAHLLLLSILISTTSSQTVVKSVYMSAPTTPLNTRSNGATLFANIAEVKRYNDDWSVQVLSQSTWQFIVSLDDTFGFDPYVQSAISITMNASAITTDELLFGFTTDNTHYVSVSVPMDNSFRSNRIYPSCTPSVVSTRPFAEGDIASIPNFDRNCDISGGSCLWWANMIPPNHEFSTQMPITFILEHNPVSHTLSVFLEEVSSPGFAQRCVFGEGFQANGGLKVYIAGNNALETFSVSSFDVKATVRDPTTSPTTDPTVSPTVYPTVSPTVNPTEDTTNPTANPSISPTLNPSIATANPSNTPTVSPSAVPTGSPTDVPTFNPSTVPTVNPSNTPTVSPSAVPTGPPTDRPTYNPSTMPSVSPSLGPTMPTLAPVTLQPSTNPTTQPTTSAPSNNPSITPTYAPSNVPTTAAPTPKQAPPGFVWGAYEQLCPESVTKTGICRAAGDVVSASNVLCLQPYDCCMCDVIECGFDGAACREIRVGAFGAMGVKDIRLAGSPTRGEASLDCQGYESCKQTAIAADHVNMIDCDGNRACQNSSLRITDPKQDFSLECSGFRSCNGLEVEINLSGPPPGELCSGAKDIFHISKISCNDKYACEGLQITINNKGCDQVMIDNLECLQPNACNDAAFNLVGDVLIDNCLCGPSCSNTIGLSQCFENLERVLCPDPFSCAGQSKTITNPKNDFEFICSDVQSCEGAQFVIELNKDIPNPVHAVSKVLFGGLNSARDATFTIVNEQAFAMAVELIECGGSGSCVGTTFVIGDNVFVENIICASDACAGCVIKQTPTGPGIPCDSSDIRPLTMAGVYV